MWKIWMLYDPRRALIAVGLFAFLMVLTNHFVQLSTPRYGSWLNEGADTSMAMNSGAAATSEMQIAQVRK